MACTHPSWSWTRLVDFCITQVKLQGLSRTCNESKEEEKKKKICNCNKRKRRGFGTVRREEEEDLDL